MPDRDHPTSRPEPEEHPYAGLLTAKECRAALEGRELRQQSAGIRERLERVGRRSDRAEPSPGTGWPIAEKDDARPGDKPTDKPVTVDNLAGR